MNKLRRLLALTAVVTVAAMPAYAWRATGELQLAQLARDAVKIRNLVMNVKNTAQMVKAQLQQLKDLGRIPQEILSTIQNDTLSLLTQGKQALEQFKGLNIRTNNLVQAFNNSTLNVETLDKLQKTLPKGTVIDPRDSAGYRRWNIRQSQEGLTRLFVQNKKARDLQDSALSKQLNVAMNGENEMQVLKGLTSIMGTMSQQLSRLEQSIDSIALVNQTIEASKMNEKEEVDKYLILDSIQHLSL